MDANVRATPRAILNGIADGSGRDISNVEERLPGHLPLLFIMSQRGPDTVEYVEDGSPARIYGSKSLVEGSEYFTHQTNLLKRFLANGNSVMVQRIVPPDAKKAMIRLSLELIPTELPEYEFNADGSIKYELNEVGVSVPKIKGTFNGTRLIWHASINPEGVIPEEQQKYRQGKIINAFRDANVQAVDNTFLSTLEGATSVLYPIMDIQIRDFGKFGNKVGLYISDMTREGIDALNMMSNINDFLYRIKVIELDEANLPVLQRTATRDTQITVSLSDDSYDPQTGFNYAITSVLGEKYDVLKDIHIYQSNLREVTDKLINGYTQDGIEVVGENTDAYNSNDYLLLNGKLNVFHGVDTQGQSYKTFTVADSYKFLGVDLTKDYILGEGGDDGLVVKATGEHDLLANLKIFDEGVRQYLNNWAVTNALLQDPAKNPFTTLWDSGFSLETKKAFAVPMAARTDIWAVISTFMVADYVGPPIEVIEPQRSWMTLMGLTYVDIGSMEPIEGALIPIEKSKLQMGITGVTNGYVVNGITAKDAGDDWNIIPLVAVIKPQDVNAIRKLAAESPDAVVIKNSKGEPLYTAAQMLELETDEAGNFKYPVRIHRSQPVGTLTLILDWDGALNNNYFTNTWSMNWNINIQEPDPVASPVTYGGIGTAQDINYLKPVDYIETVDYISEQELNLNITNRPAAGWYWKYIHLNAVISKDFIEVITKQAANGLESTIITVDHNGDKVSYKAGEVITLNNDEEGNLLIPLLLNRNKTSGIINVLADYDGNDGRRFYQSPLKINYTIDPVNPPQQVSNIEFIGFDRSHEPVKDGEYLNPAYGRISEHTPNTGTDQLFKITNVAEAGWYWNKIRMYALIAAEDIAAMTRAREAGYEGIVLTIKQNGVVIRTSTAAQVEVLTKDVEGNAIVPLEINRNQPTGTFVFDMDWDASHLDYLPGKKVVEYQLTPVNPVPLKSWVTYQGLDTLGITLPPVETPEVPGPWYKDLRVETLDSLNSVQELSLSGNTYTNKITNRVSAGWYWDRVPVYFTIAKDAIDLIKLAVTKNHVGEVLAIKTQWRNYSFTSEQILAAEQANGTAWLTIDIPRNYPSGKITANVDWDLGIYPEATSTTIDINYTLNIVNPPQTLSVVKWGGVDKSYPNVVDAPYLRPDNYIENVIVTISGSDITIGNGAGAGWYWTEIHINLVIAKKDVDAMINAQYNGFIVDDILINHNETVTRVSLAELSDLEKDTKGNYLYPITLNRAVDEGYITVTVDWDGNHKDYLKNTTVFNYVLEVTNPNPLESAITYRGVKTLRERRALTVNAPGIISNSYLTETFTGTPDGYTVKIVTDAAAGWYWTNIQTWLAVAPDVLVFLENAKAKGHVGKVLTISNGPSEVSYTTQEILDLEKDTDGAALIPYLIPRTRAIGNIVATVDWDTSVYPEANANVINIGYNIEINNPVQVASEMLYVGIDKTIDYETNGEFLVPQYADEVITSYTNSYHSVISVREAAGWYWNKINVAAKISAKDLLVIEEAKNAGYVGTVLSAYKDGSQVHSLDADAILALRRNEDGDALVPFILTSDKIDGEVTAVIDWDVNHLDYTQSTWRLSYRLEIRRPNMVSPKFTVEEDFVIEYPNLLPINAYEFSASNADATVKLQDIYPETADKVGLKYSLDFETSRYIRELSLIDPDLVILTSGFDGKTYTALQLANAITNNPSNRLEYYIPASRQLMEERIKMILDLDGPNNLYRPEEHFLTYKYTTSNLGASTLLATYVDSTFEPNFVKAYQTDNTINVVLTSAPTDRNKYQMEFKINGAEYAAFQKAREMGMPRDTIVLTMVLTGTNQTITCTAAQLEALVYLDDLKNAYFTHDFDVNHGDIQFSFHWTNGYGGYKPGTMKLTMNLLVLVQQRLNVVNYTFDDNYGEQIIPTKEYQVTVTDNPNGLASTANVRLDDNYPIDRSQVRLAITFPAEVSNRIMALITEAPTTPVFKDNQSGQVYTAMDFTGMLKDSERFIYPIILSVGSGSGILSYKLTLNGAGEDLYPEYNYTVNFGIGTGTSVNPTLKPVVTTDGTIYTTATVTTSGSSYNLTLDCVDPLVPAFGIDLVIPKEYHSLILEAIENNPNELIISGDNLTIYGKDFVGLPNDEVGNKVIRNYMITPNPDNATIEDPTIVKGKYSFNLSYTPNYSGAKAITIDYNLTVNITAMDISCEQARPSTYAEFSGDLTTAWFDVQLDGVFHKNINYARLVELCKASGIEVIPFSPKSTLPEIPVVEHETTEFKIGGQWKVEVDGVVIYPEARDIDEVFEVLKEDYGVEFVNTVEPEVDEQPSNVLNTFEFNQLHSGDTFTE